MVKGTLRPCQFCFKRHKSVSVAKKCAERHLVKANPFSLKEMGLERFKTKDLE